MTTPENTHTQPSGTSESIEPVRSFALSEDWLATIVGLVLVTLILIGVITPDWLPL